MKYATCLWILCFVIGCASQAWNKEMRVQAQHAHAKQTYALTQSYYFSQLYDDNERWLLSERPSGEISHRISLRGQPIHPPEAEGILPAGTPMVLERIEFPTRTAVMHRMLNSPVHHIWLRLRPAPGSLVALPRNNRPFVMVLEANIESPAELTTAIDARLQAAHVVTGWLTQLGPSIRVGVQTKQITRGMDERALVAAAGAPREWRPLGSVAGHDTKIARYANEEAWLVDGVVAEIHPLDGRSN